MKRWQLVTSHLVVLGSGVGLGFAVGRWTVPEEELDGAGLARMLAPLAAIPVVAEVRVTPPTLSGAGGDVDVTVRVEAGTMPSEVSFRVTPPGSGKPTDVKITTFKPGGANQWYGSATYVVRAGDPAGQYTVTEVTPKSDKGAEGLVYDEPGVPAAVVTKNKD